MSQKATATNGEPPNGSPSESAKPAVESSSFVVVSREDLVATFSAAKHVVAEVNATELGPNDPTLKDLVEKGIVLLGKAEEGIRRLELFSKNEHAVDVHTEDLEFILCEMLLGKLYLKRPGGMDKEKRLKNLQQALVCFDRFIEKCDRLQLVDPVEKQGIEVVVNNAPQDATSRRQMKIDRFNRTRECKKQLEKIEQDLNQQRKQQTVDEELLRERLLLVISNSIREVLEDYALSADEKNMLEQIVRMERLSPTESKPPQPPQQKGECLYDVSVGMNSMNGFCDVENKGITVTKIDKQFNVTRETLKAGVFKPGWRQPTVSIEEYAKIEVERARERAEREAEAAKEEPEHLKYEQLVERGLEDDEKLLDKATMNDRNWDNWKDDNPKGSGVTKRY